MSRFTKAGQRKLKASGEQSTGLLLQPKKAPATDGGYEPSTRLRTLQLIGGFAISGLLLVVFVLITFGTPPMMRLGSSGPRPSGQLVPVSTLKAAEYQSLAVSPIDAQQVWAGSHTELRESTDGGRSWQTVRDINGDPLCVATTYADPARVYVAGKALLKLSIDGGRTWQAVQTDLPEAELGGFASDPGNANHVYTLVVQRGVFESKDGGQHWNLLAGQPIGASGPLAVAEGSSPTLYAATNIGVMLSADGGHSWHPVGSGLPQGEGDVRALTRVPGKPEQIYAGTMKGLYHTEDRGATWHHEAFSGVQVVALTASQSSGPLRLYALTVEGAVYSIDEATLRPSN